MSTGLTERVTTPLTEQVAEEIRVVMTRRRIKQSELARALEKSEQWVSVRLRGVQPIDLNDLQRIADVLNVEASDLLPRINEGRTIAVVGRGSATNERSASLSKRLHRASTGMSTKPTSGPRQPNGRPRSGSAAPDPARPPTQRRAALVNRPG